MSLSMCYNVLMSNLTTKNHLKYSIGYTLFSFSYIVLFIAFFIAYIYSFVCKSSSGMGNIQAFIFIIGLLIYIFINIFSFVIFIIERETQFKLNNVQFIENKIYSFILNISFILNVILLMFIIFYLIL